MTEYTTEERVSGASTRNFNADTRPDGSADWWGTSEITNDGGRWLGVWRGSLDVQGNLTIAWTSIGSGDYAGLRYRANVVSPSDATDLTVTRTIEPAG